MAAPGGRWERAPDPLQFTPGVADEVEPRGHAEVGAPGRLARASMTSCFVSVSPP